MAAPSPTTGPAPASSPPRTTSPSPPLRRFVSSSAPAPTPVRASAATAIPAAAASTAASPSSATGTVEGNSTVLVAEKLGAAGLALLREFASIDCSYGLPPGKICALGFEEANCCLRACPADGRALHLHGLIYEYSLLVHGFVQSNDLW